MIRILATDGMDRAAAENLRELGYEITEQFFEPDELFVQLKEYDAVVVRSATKIRRPHIDAALESGRLKLIIRGGVGTDNINVSYAESKGIEVRNTPAASSVAVAELTLAHIFTLARHLNESNISMREGKWEKKAYKGTEISGKTLGLIGFGLIGKSAADKARGLGMNVIYCDIAGPSPEGEGCKYVGRSELFETSDFISIHTPKNDEPLITSAEIARMKDGVYIINCARGGLIDENDLADALDSGKIAGAGLDVFSDEPTVNERLLNHPNISLTPHIGASTDEAQKRIGEEIVSIIREKFGS